MYYNLYVDEKQIKLNFFEERRLKKIYKKLEKIRNNEYKSKLYLN